MGKTNQEIDTFAPNHPWLNPFYKIFVDPNVNCVFVKHTNQLTVNIIHNRYEDIWQAPNTKPGMNFLIDCTECSNELSEEEVRALATFLNSKQEFLGDCKQAILCNSFIDHGYSRMLDSLCRANKTENCSCITTMICNTEDFTDPVAPIRKIKKWLELDPNYPLPF